MSRKALTCLSSCLARTAVEGVVRSHGNVWRGLAASRDGDYAKQTAKQERAESQVIAPVCNCGLHALVSSALFFSSVVECDACRKDGLMGSRENAAEVTSWASECSASAILTMPSCDLTKVRLRSIA